MLSGLVATTFSGHGGVGAAQVCENMAVDTSWVGGTILPLETAGTLYLEKGMVSIDVKCSTHSETR